MKKKVISTVSGFDYRHKGERTREALWSVKQADDKTAEADSPSSPTTELQCTSRMACMVSSVSEFRHRYTLGYPQVFWRLAMRFMDQVIASP
jgi:hypothetical protein